MVLTISPVKIFTLYPVGNEDKSCHLTGTMFARNLAHDASGGRDRNAFDLSFSSNPSMNFNFDLLFFRSLVHSFLVQSLGPTRLLFRRSIRAKSTPIKELPRHSKASRASNSSTGYIPPSSESRPQASSLMLFREPPFFPL